MAAGAAGPPGDPALEVIGQGAEAATTLPPAEVAATAPDCRRSRSPVRTQTSSTYSKDTFTHTHKHVCHVAVGQRATLTCNENQNPVLTLQCNILSSGNQICVTKW